MAKILCVQYDDPIGGMPSSYPRDDLPRVNCYPGGMTLPTPQAIDFTPGELLGCTPHDSSRTKGVADLNRLAGAGGTEAATEKSPAL